MVGTGTDLGDEDNWLLSGEAARCVPAEATASGLASGSEYETGRREGGGGCGGGGGEKVVMFIAKLSGALDELWMAELALEVDAHGPEGVRCMLLDRWKVLGEREEGDGLE